MAAQLVGKGTKDTSREEETCTGIIQRRMDMKSNDVIDSKELMNGLEYVVRPCCGDRGKQLVDSAMKCIQLLDRIEYLSERWIIEKKMGTTTFKSELAYVLDEYENIVDHN